MFSWNCFVLCLPGTDPWFVIGWCLTITSLLAATQPKSMEESMESKQTLKGLKRRTLRHKGVSRKYLFKDESVRFQILRETYINSGIEMVSLSSTWTWMQSLISSSDSGVNFRQTLTDKPDARETAPHGGSSLNTWGRKDKSQVNAFTGCTF